MVGINSVAAFFIVVVNVVAYTAQGKDSQFISHEHKLYKALMKDYEKWVRPVPDPSKAVNVSFGMTLQGIIEVDEYKHHLVLLTWWNMGWTDFQLAWNTSDYGGISTINIPRSDVWFPDLAVYNSVGDQPVLQNSDLVVVSSTGHVTYVPPLTINAMCTFDYTWYPYDEQMCDVKIGSWTYHGQKLNLTMASDKVDTSTYGTNPYWKLVLPMVMRRNVVKYDCCPETYIDITANIRIRRQPSYMAHVLIIPGVIMAFLIPFIFLFPPDAGEKISLGVGLLLGYLLLLVVGDNMQSGILMSNPPIIFRYYIVNIVLIGISMIASMTIVQLWRDRGRAYPPPKPLSKIFIDGLGCLMCVRRNNYQHTPRTVNVEAESGQSDTDKIGQDVADVDGEWKLLAIVLDRLLFLVFLVISIIVAILMISI